MTIYCFRVKYVGGDKHPRRGEILLDSYVTARAANPTTGMQRALTHILRERRRDPNVSAWEVHSIEFSSAQPLRLA